MGIGLKHASGFRPELFLKEVGVSPTSYLFKVRLVQAQQKLFLTEVVLDIGYQVLYSFSRNFTRLYGVPLVVIKILNVYNP